MDRLIIVGAGGFGREVLAWAQDCEAQGTDWQFGGFLDDNLDALKNFETEAMILGTVSDYQPAPGDVFVCAMGNPKYRRRCVEQLISRGARFVSLVHPTAVIGTRCKLGVGVIVCPFSVLTTDVVVGDHTSLNIRCSVGHDARIGEFCQLSSFCDVTGYVTLEDDVFLGSHASILPGVCVEQGAKVAAGSVAIMRVKSGTTVIGVPAKPLK